VLAIDVGLVDRRDPVLVIELLVDVYEVHVVGAIFVHWNHHVQLFLSASVSEILAVAVVFVVVFVAFVALVYNNY
jgi:hypothetical protein